MRKDRWVWMPHAAHFICGHSCQFRLATYVGKYIVSTVGEYRSTSSESKLDFNDIGCNRKYETMVFKAKKSKHKCCPYVVSNHSEIDSVGYNSCDDAKIGHYKLCEKWSK